MGTNGRPPTGQRDCLFLREKLLAEGLEPGTRVPRPIWDKALVQALDLTYAAVAQITKTGELHDCWIRHPHHGQRPGSIEIIAPP